MDKIWERQPEEGDKAFKAFQLYLLGDRNCERVAQEQHKTPQHIRRWAAKYNWRARCKAFDDSLIEDLRADLKRGLETTLKNQWQSCTELQELAFKSLKAKDLKAAGFRTLNEIFQGAANFQLKLIETLNLLDDDTGETQNLQINIVRAKERRKNEI